MEERVSGFSARGSWEDVVEHGERVTRAFEGMDVDGSALEEWNEWRPKRHEALEVEVSEKTVEHARIEEGPGERAGQPPHADLERAAEEAAESIEKVEGDGPEEILEKWQRALEHVARAADTTARKVLRSVERPVYEHVVTRFAPYYFDNELVSANIRRTSRLGDAGEFVFEVGVNDDRLEDELARRLGTANETEGA